MAKVILAVSGGIDSMVMLDMFGSAKKYSSRDINVCASLSNYALTTEFIVAHFDHGIRENSQEDADFVRQRANDYGLSFVHMKSSLSCQASEESARRARYDFLMHVSAVNDHAEIFTAHHLDDMVESVAINLLRGTGWRGLAVLSRTGVRRPFLEPKLLQEFGYNFVKPLQKKDLWRYAGEHNLTFRDDQTNSSDEYLRNRVRHKTNIFCDSEQLFALRQEQLTLRTEISDILNALVQQVDGEWQRQWFQTLDPHIALELLRAATLKVGIKATRPQLESFRQAIINYSPGKYFNLPDDKLVQINKRVFCLR